MNVARTKDFIDHAEDDLDRANILDPARNTRSLPR